MNGLPALDAPLPPIPVSAEFTGDEPFMMSGSTPILVEGRRGDVEYMAFPRLTGAAEIGWPPPEAPDRETLARALGRTRGALDALG